MDHLYQIASALGLGSPAHGVDVLHMALRAGVAYVVAYLAVGVGRRRFPEKGTLLDVAMIVILGSVVSRAINGEAPMMPTLAAAATLVLAHRLMLWITGRFRALGAFGGKAALLVENGTVDRNAMRTHGVTEQDLYSALRQTMNTNDLSKVKHVYLEPNGRLSIVRR